MKHDCDVLIVGTGSLAKEALYGLSAVAAPRLRVVIAGRDGGKARWLATTANARALLLGGGLTAEGLEIDWSSPDSPAELVTARPPKIALHAASLQSPWTLSETPSAWLDLVQEAGYGVTTPLQAALAIRLGRVLREHVPAAVFLNACYPDVVNPLLAAQGIPVTAGIGNVAIMAALVAAHLNVRDQGHLRMLAHHRHLAVWNKLDDRSDRRPRLWIDGRPEDTALAPSRIPIVSGSTLNAITGCTAIPMILAFLTGKEYRGHAPGPLGLPGGYPIRISGGELALDLPDGLAVGEAAAWNRAFEPDEGIQFDGGEIRFSPSAARRLAAVDPAFPLAFQPDDLEDIAGRMLLLRDSLGGA